MTYNELAISLLEIPSGDYVPCYVSSTSYQHAMNEASITFIHSYDEDLKVFQDTYDYEWEYVLPLTIKPTKLPTKEKPVSININTDVKGNKQSVILQFFAYDHLPEHLQEISQEFFFMAEYLDRVILTSAEKSVALRKLLESKDSAVRAAMLGVQ